MRVSVMTVKRIKDAPDGWEPDPPTVRKISKWLDAGCPVAPRGKPGAGRGSDRSSARTSELPESASSAYELIWASVRAAMGKGEGVDLTYVEDHLETAIEVATGWGWDPAPLHEMLRRVRSGDV